MRSTTEQRDVEKVVGDTPPEDIYDMARRLDPDGFFSNKSTRNKVPVQKVFANHQATNSLKNSKSGTRCLPECMTPLCLSSSARQRMVTGDRFFQSYFEMGNIKLENVNDGACVSISLFPALALNLEGSCFDATTDLKRRGICFFANSDGLRVGDVRKLNDGTNVIILALLVVDKMERKREMNDVPFTFLALVGDLSEPEALKCYIVCVPSIMTLATEMQHSKHDDDFISSQVYAVTESLYAQFNKAGLSLLTNGEKSDDNMFRCSIGTVPYLGDRLKFGSKIGRPIRGCTQTQQAKSSSPPIQAKPLSRDAPLHHISSNKRNKTEKKPARKSANKGQTAKGIVRI